MLTVILFAALATLGCGPAADRSGGARRAPAVEQSEIPNVTPPTDRTAVVTFVLGDVESTIGSDWHAVNLGDTLQPEHHVRTAAGSSCEIQFGSLAVARLEENTEVAISTLSFGEAREVGMSLSFGAVVSKVEKLADNDQYNIQTPTAIAGVRGTEFRVQTGGAEATSLAVREGTVTVLPPQATPEALRQSAQGISEADARELSAAIASSARAVTKDEEIVVTTSDFAKATEQLTEVHKKLTEGASLDSVKPLVEAAAKSISEEAPKPTAISPEAQSALAVAATMQLLPAAPPAPPPPAGAPQAAAPQAQQAAPQAPAAPTVVPLSVTVDPRAAEILVNGNAIGTGSFSRLYPVGETLNLTARLTGYEPESVDFTVPAKGTALTIRLQPQRSVAPPPAPAASAPSAPQPEATAPAETPAAAATLPAAAPEPAASSAAASAAEPAPTLAAAPATAAPAAPPPPARVPLFIQVAPESASIFVNGARVGLGQATVELDDKTKATVEARAQGYESATQTIAIDSALPARIALRLVRIVQYGTLAVSAEPPDARLFVNGALVGTGSYRAQLEENTSVSVRAERRGYAVAEASVRITPNTTITRTLRLERKPIEGVFQVTQGAIVKSITAAEDSVIFADAKGAVRSLASSGKVNWSVVTANSPNDNSAPVFSGKFVYFSGSKELVGIEAASGTVLFRRPLAQSEAHTFGREVAVSGGELYCPVDSSILVFAEGTNRMVRQIPLPVASSGTPCLSNGLLYLADQEGTLDRIDAASGKLIKSIESKAAQPVATSPVVVGDGRVAFVGRRGVVAVADQSGIIWQRPLDSGQSVSVFTDPVVGAGAIYLFGKNTLYALSAANGDDLFKPIANVSAPPLVDGDSLYYGTTDGQLVRANARTGAAAAHVTLPGPASARPVRIGEDVVVGLKSGQVVFIYPETM